MQFGRRIIKGSFTGVLPVIHGAAAVSNVMNTFLSNQRHLWCRPATSRIRDRIALLLRSPALQVLLLFFVSAAASFQADAGVIYSQLPTGGSFLSSTDINGGSNLEQFVWESFSTPTTQTLREIQWRGVRSGTAPADFQITIGTNTYSGGTVWHTNNAASETPTGTPGVYDYKFTLPAGFTLTGGQGYWLQIVGLVNNFYPYGGTTWAWSAGTGGNGVHLAQIPAITGDFRIAAVAGDVAFTLLNAATVPVAIAVQALPAAGGTATGGGTFAAGTSVTVVAQSAAGHAFLNWTEAGVVVSTSASFTFAADGNKTLSANFSGPNTGPYVITAAAVPTICGTVGGAGTIAAGEIATLDSSVNDGYLFVSWTENGNVVSTNPTYNFTATANRNLQANFTIPGGSIAVVGTPSPAYAGTVSVAGTSGSYANTFVGGSTVTLTATPVPGYHFVNWTQGADAGGPQRTVGTSSPSFTFIVAYGAFLTANFEADNPVLTLGVTPAGCGTVTGAGAYTNGSSVTANATPAVGYAFVNWTQGGTVVSTNPGYTLPLTNPVSLTANFVATNRTITATAAPLAGGSFTGTGVFGNGATVTLNAIPAPGYIFTSWTLNGATAGTDNPAVFNANANYAFSANFSPGFTVAASAAQPADGTVSGAGAFLTGAVVNLVATPAAGYAFVNWTENGLPVSASPGYSFVVGANRVVVANFELIIPQVALPPSASGTLVLQWPAALPGWVLQESPDLSPGSWITSPAAITVIGTSNQAVFTTLTERRYFRLIHP